MDKKTIQRNLLKWFGLHKRVLPWRAVKRDPYQVWLSEIMLQQTQVATVIPYFTRWLERFPILADFAAAPLDDVLKQWEGLGYYSRARNFHRAAQMVMNEHAGEIPSTVEGLLKLPGIGRYTAGAIASFAFGRDAPVLDGNVKRVWARLFVLTEIDDDALWALSVELLPKGRAGEFNEALMDLGATICTPRNPKCSACPLVEQCAAYEQGNPERYPIKVAKTATPHKNIGTLVLLNAHGQVLMGQRPNAGLLGGLWEFVSSEIGIAVAEALPLFDPAADPMTQIAAQVLTRIGAAQLDLQAMTMLGTVKHAFTHFKITKHVVLAQVDGPLPEFATTIYQQLKWVRLPDLTQLALTRSDQKIGEMVLKQKKIKLKIKN